MKHINLDLPEGITLKYMFQFYRLKREALEGLYNKPIRELAKEKADYWGSHGIYIMTDNETGKAFFSM